MIISEDQAEKIGEQITGGARGRDFIVFYYKHMRTKLTLFGVEITATEETIWSQ